MIFLKSGFATFSNSAVRQKVNSNLSNQTAENDGDVIVKMVINYTL